MAAREGLASMDLLAPWRWSWARLPRISMSFGVRLHRSMATALAIAVYVGLGAAIVAAAVWYADAVLQRFFTMDPTPAIAPITIVGADEAVAKSYAAGLPTMIIAATNDLKLRANAAIRTLAEAKNELAQSPKPVEDVDLPVPSEFREELTVNLKIADVDVGPLLSFLLERARDPNVLRLTVALDADGKGSDVYGFLPGQAGYGFAARSSGDLPGIARAVAVQLVRAGRAGRGVRFRRARCGGIPSDRRGTRGLRSSRLRAALDHRGRGIGCDRPGAATRRICRGLGQGEVYGATLHRLGGPAVAGCPGGQGSGRLGICARSSTAA